MSVPVIIAMLTLISVTALAVMTGVVAQQPTELCMDADTRDKARALMFEGINEALTRHTANLFDNLMKDRGHDPDRMTRGMYTSLALYARSRKNLLAWSPPPCKEP